MMPTTADHACAVLGHQDKTEAEHRAAQLRQRVIALFERTFGGPPTGIARAPGRVNLIGEHTDYNGGYVLPCAIDWHTLVAVRARADNKVRVVAGDQHEALDEFKLDAPVQPGGDKPWAAYVRGMAWAMRRQSIPLQGADMAIAGNVPLGAGLSSSAALAVAVGHAFGVLMGDKVPRGLQLARMAQAAENEFVGCQCGIMDQMISACAPPDHALLIDCQTMESQAVAVPDGVSIMIVHSQVKRGLVESQYNERRRQCEAAARHFGLGSLRELTLEHLQDRPSGLNDTAWRRARHVVTENARTLEAAKALRQANLRALGAAMRASHTSLRDDFEVTVPPVDQLADLLNEVVKGQGGARMTGGGFGGCVVAVLPDELVATARQAVLTRYRAPSGDAAAIFVTTAASGAGSEQGANGALSGQGASMSA